MYLKYRHIRRRK